MAEKASSRSLLFARCVIFHFVTLKSSKQSSHTVINLHPCQPGLCCQMALWVNHIRAHARTHTNAHHAEMCNRPRTFCFLQCWMKATKPEESVCNQSSVTVLMSYSVCQSSSTWHLPCPECHRSYVHVPASVTLWEGIFTSKWFAESCLCCRHPPPSQFNNTKKKTPNEENAEVRLHQTSIKKKMVSFNCRSVQPTQTSSVMTDSEIQHRNTAATAATHEHLVDDAIWWICGLCFQKKMDGLVINFDQYCNLELFFHGDNDIKSNINIKRNKSWY